MNHARNALFLTEGGKVSGFGHITRCMAISQALNEADFKTKMIINGDDSVRTVLADQSVEMLNWVSNLESLKPSLAASDVIIVDSYLADVNVYRSLSQISSFNIYIDDNNRLLYPAGVILNGNVHAQQLDYKREENQTYLLGSEYLHLRKNYWHAPAKIIKDDIETLLITLGGSDVLNLMPRLLDQLEETEYVQKEKIVIVGQGFPDIETLQNRSGDKLRIVVGPTAEEMRHYMDVADVAISGGGQTLYELLTVGVPVITLMLADNQQNIVHGCAEQASICLAGDYRDEALMLDNVFKYLNMMKTKEYRMKLSTRAQSVSDGQGCIRIKDFILDNLKTASLNQGTF